MIKEQKKMIVQISIWDQNMGLKIELRTKKDLASNDGRSGTMCTVILSRLANFGQVTRLTNQIIRTTCSGQNYCNYYQKILAYL